MTRETTLDAEVVFNIAGLAVKAGVLHFARYLPPAQRW